MVRLGGSMDYKSFPDARAAAAMTGINPYLEFGNFNYGATGRALGIPDAILVRAAGVAQFISGWQNWNPSFGVPGHAPAPYGDDPVDQAAIRAGIAYAECIASNQ